MKNLALLGIYFALAVSVGAQELAEHQKAEMLDCTFHRKGTWVAPNFYSDGKLRFSYVLEPTANKRPGTLYVAFWNPAKTEGKLIEFHVTKMSEQKDAFATVNEGWIWNNKGQLDVRDALGGIYTYQQLKDRLPELSRRRVYVVTMDQLRPTSAACSSPLDEK